MKKTLELTPTEGEMLKPKELIEVRGVGKFTLQDRRIYNALIENAWGEDLGKADVTFEIGTGDLKDLCEGNARLRDTLRTLQTTLVEVDSGGRWQSVQLLGYVDLETTANRGTLRYALQPQLAVLLKDSTIFAKLDHEVMKTFKSKYAFSLYEAIARRVRMKAFMEELSLSDIRNLLGVEDGKLKGYGNLNKFAIQPALLEVNAISDFSVSIVPKKKGKKVVSFLMGWSMKDEAGKMAAYAERHRHSAGRKARTVGATEDVTDTVTLTE